ncbi:penicillin-binding transpeptidase domain-containing protein [Taibaiella sp. KBW10]|uniref:penicillin-binding transpeptidase domain-containing protein n=1 Tax=Taibaiella sp. KBW10 TaxID=2153357 RepID=UPI0013157B07|nr:penicillin-binding transpeptidase domain-containing protein [Taibaiella sp. KBW10]
MRKIAVMFTGIGLVLGLGACSDVRINDHEEWKPVFDKYQITNACFEYYDNNKEEANFYNKLRCSERMSPASTFKIFNSLVALETGVALDEQMLIKFDGKTKFYRNGKLLKQGEDTTGAFTMPEWNKDLTMTQAFKVSAVPYYQELARRIGIKEMQHFLDTVQYGNMNIGGVIDEFWLNDSLKITPDEQVGFMKRLYHDELPFSPRSQRIVKGMMLQETDGDYRLYYKTGWSSQPGREDIIWVVGYAETVHRLKNPKTNQIQAIPHPYFFALNYSIPKNAQNVVETRKKLLHDLLTEVGIHKY